MKEILGKFSETKISYFCFSVMDEYISNLQIPMNDILLCQVQESFENISNDWFCSFLCKELSVSEFTFEITLVTQFGNDITVSITSEYLETPKNVGMIKFLKHVNL